ncbi:MAG TPA: acyl-[acyl-carrier-protein] thioesterase [Prevotella sp.]|nr:acyl-[acyl-carrier-protein] thioesterase [Prevotella sp.]
MENKELLPKVGAYKFQIEPFHCDFSNRLFPGHLGNGMLNAADYHSGDRGYGVAELNLSRKTWVLSRFAIEIMDMPKAYEKVEVQTWVESVKKFFTSRNYAVVSPDGTKPYAYGRSIWAMIDIDTRQPTDIYSVHDGLIEKYVNTKKECPIAPPARVAIGQDLELAREINIYYNDIDINGHLNSVKYIDHVLDLFDIDYYRTHHLRRIDIAYVAEAHVGDVVRLYKAQVEEGAYVVKMTKLAGKEVEIVRCMVKFVKD